MLKEWWAGVQKGLRIVSKWESVYEVGMRGVILQKRGRRVGLYRCRAVFHIGRIKLVFSTYHILGCFWCGGFTMAR